jgi:hypothetical protein
VVHRFTIDVADAETALEEFGDWPKWGRTGHEDLRFTGTYAGVWTCSAVILVATAPALAQDKPVDFNIGFGPTFPSSGFKDSFDTGTVSPVGPETGLSPFARCPRR